MMEHITGDIVQEMFVGLVDYADKVEIVPMRKIIGGESILSMPIEGGWKEIELKTGYVVSNDEFSPLTMPLRWAKLLRDELVKVLGHPEKDATTQELGATKYHLEDMRSLVFKDGGGNDISG